MSPVSEVVGVSEPALRWVHEELRVVNLTPVRVRPWAALWRVEAVEGLWWLKVSPPSTGHEPRLLALLQASGAALVPTVVAHPTQPWVLLADAGRSARELFPSGPEATGFWCQLMAGYAELQRSVGEVALRAAGVPDASPGALPALLETLLAEPAWLAPEYAPDLTAGDRALLAAARRPLAELARRLQDGPPPAVQHDDLHGNNVLVADGRATIIDWGDACLAHPFGTLLVTMRSLAADWAVGVDDPGLLRVRAAYLEPWRTGGESGVELDRQVELALRTGPGPRVRLAPGARSPRGGLELGYADATASWLLEAARLLADPEPGGDT
jgi:hypothetical protein